MVALLHCGAWPLAFGANKNGCSMDLLLSPQQGSSQQLHGAKCTGASRRQKRKEGPPKLEPEQRRGLIITCTHVRVYYRSLEAMENTRIHTPNILFASNVTHEEKGKTHTQTGSYARMQEKVGCKASHSTETLWNTYGTYL